MDGLDRHIGAGELGAQADGLLDLRGDEQGDASLVVFAEELGNEAGIFSSVTLKALDAGKDSLAKAAADLKVMLL